LPTQRLEALAVVGGDGRGRDVVLGGHGGREPTPGRRGEDRSGPWARTPRDMRRTTVIALITCCALAGCGGAGAPAHDDAPAATAYAAHGLAVRLPSGWQAARVSLTPHLVDPREELAVATFPLRYRPTACAHMPGSALADLGPRDAFVTLMERRRHSAVFPPRPADF